MGAPKGNQFWKLRSKHGRDRLFSTPELLWEAACEYFEWCDNNPFYEALQASGGQRVIKDEDGNSVTTSGIIELPRMRPYSLHGLALYLDASISYFNAAERAAEEKGEKDFLTVFTRIREVIYNQQLSGAASGFLKENLISRVLGLKDKTDVTTNDEAINSGEVTHRWVVEDPKTDQ